MSVSGEVQTMKCQAREEGAGTCSKDATTQRELPLDRSGVDRVVLIVVNLCDEHAGDLPTDFRIMRGVHSWDGFKTGLVDAAGSLYERT